MTEKFPQVYGQQRHKSLHLGQKSQLQNYRKKLRENNREENNNNKNKKHYSNNKNSLIEGKSKMKEGKYSITDCCQIIVSKVLPLF